MALSEDLIVDIKSNQVRYFGTPGKMLLPSRGTVETLISKIPEHSLLTTDLLRKTLAEQFKVQGTCPVTTKKALRAIANDPTRQVPYWRVIKQNGELMGYYPGGVHGHAQRLLDEGHEIDTGGKIPKVAGFKARLMQFRETGT